MRYVGGWASEQTAQGAIVMVSETTAPEGWRVIHERRRKGSLRVAEGRPNHERVERLFVQGDHPSRRLF